MAWYNPFKKKESEVDKILEKPEIVVDDFSTNLSRYRSEKRSSLNMWINENMFQRKGPRVNFDGKKGHAMDSAIAMDSQVKSAFSLASSNLPQVLFSWYVQQGFIGYQACAVIAQNALINKACLRPAQKALKKGYSITVNDGTDVDEDDVATIRSLDKKFKLRKNLIELENMRRTFGVRVAIFEVDSKDPDYYLKPFNIDGVTKGSYKGISQVDPYWITPELDDESTSDPSSIDFYEPTWWRVNGKRYHKSHLIVVRYAEVPDVLKPSYFYGGVPLPQLIYERVYAAERTANEAPQLALTKRVNIVKTDIKKAMSNQKAIEERMVTFNDFRDNHAVLLIDKEEEYQQTDTALADLDNVIMTQYQLVAALAGIPASELIETSPKGFNATGEFEKESWYDTLEAIQEDIYTPMLERHYELLMRSEGMIPFEFEIAWNPLDSPTAKEIAEINEINSRNDTQLATVGAIDSFEVRDRIIADKNSGYNGLQGFTEEDMTNSPEEVEEPKPLDG